MAFDDKQYEVAQKRVKLKKGFYRHLASFIVIGLFFFIINLTTDSTDIWFHFPMVAWGIGLAFHYIRVFGVPYVGALDGNWEAEEIEKELNKMRGTRPEKPKSLSAESHEIDELDLDNRYHFNKEAADSDKWGNYDDKDLKTLRKDFDEEFK
jgi:hypothetical protein